ncbi:uncharacterized protein PHACADRAFT_177971 [Phanerochaete carnosa HHB-10118-sp]|uniref:Uncharacterized protein n=1 Tax=Phanerochaete carnosa (strain HHB-10118-sp) TaxID=650164 RepID=K5VX21_PHACS|nr:uncharacterized protein PHACADRAFT_177971 [Phanerochaete carnosa HHB-10118-sp]EKM51320.1 hypothetical protein PHACADRAFT_177971 [Phanerochaete carnosa HHB-10118-sp]
MTTATFLGPTPSLPAKVAKAFEIEAGVVAAYYPGWYKAADYFSWAGPFFGALEATSLFQPSASRTVDVTAEKTKNAWVQLLAFGDVFEFCHSLIDDTAWDPIGLASLFKVPVLNPASIDLLGDSDDSFAEPTTPTENDFEPLSAPQFLEAVKARAKAADCSLACVSPSSPATTIFIDGEVIPALTAEDRQLAFKHRVLARAGLSASAPTSVPASDSPSKPLNVSARPFRPSAETAALAVYMSRNPGDAKAAAKLFQMRMRVQACAG